jgi:alginate O-acetyltransferase complex protein AlgI
MLFNSPEFLFAFLPLTVVVFHLIPRLLGHDSRGMTTAKGWILVASLFFYGYWDFRQLPILLGSMAFNYAVGRGIAASWGIDGRSGRARVLLVIGVVLNLAVLGYFKYAAFFAENLNAAFGLGLPVLHPVLPLGISFFTFQELAFLVDAYRERFTPDEYRRTFRPINFCLFIAFFPQITAGPIARRHEILPQLDGSVVRRTDWDALAVGLWMLVAGLFKKVVVAEAFAVWATRGFDEAPALGFADAWLSSLSYTFQVYFDFSGYSDMAIGCGSMLRIAIPINFNSPYQATSIQDYWRRWHISLSSFLRDYVLPARRGAAGDRPCRLQHLRDPPPVRPLARGELGVRLLGLAPWHPAHDPPILEAHGAPDAFRPRLVSDLSRRQPYQGLLPRARHGIGVEGPPRDVRPGRLG